MTRGYSSPRTPEGRASLVPYPPWHYVADFLVLEFWAEPAQNPGSIQTFRTTIEVTADHP